MAQWPTGCTLLPRKPGTPRRPEGGNDETLYQFRDDRCGRPDRDRRSGFGAEQADGGGPLRFPRRQQRDGTGTIQVRVVNGNTANGALVINNFQAKRSYVVLSKSVGDAPKNWKARGVPKLRVDCSYGTCILAKAWNAEGHGYEFHRPK